VQRIWKVVYFLYRFYCNDMDWYSLISHPSEWIKVKFSSQIFLFTFSCFELTFWHGNFGPKLSLLFGSFVSRSSTRVWNYCWHMWMFYQFSVIYSHSFPSTILVFVYFRNPSNLHTIFSFRSYHKAETKSFNNRIYNTGIMEMWRNSNRFV